MTNKRFISLAAAAIAATMLMTSCGLLGYPEEEAHSYFQTSAFQKEDNGLYGIMTTEGVVVCEPQFKNAPTNASCDRFFVKDDDGLWKLYTLEANPKPVGDKKYHDVGSFVEGLCPVSEPDSWPKYINPEGEVVFEAKEYKGKQIIKAGNFMNGLASIQTEDELTGFIDKTGTVVIEPVYQKVTYFYTDYAIAYRPVEKGKDPDSQQWVIIDKSGKEVFASKLSKMEPCIGGFDRGNLTVASIKDGTQFVLINEKGEKVHTFEKTVSSVFSMFDGLIVFSDEDFKLGAMDAEGKVVIEPQYEKLVDDGGAIIAQDTDEDEYTIYNRKGEELKTITANKLWLPDWRYINYKNIILCYQDTITGYFLDAQGNRLQQSATFANASGDAMTAAASDYDIASLMLKKLNITQKGMLGVDMDKTYGDLDLEKNPLSNYRDIALESDKYENLAFKIDLIGLDIEFYIYYITDRYDDNNNARIINVQAYIDTGKHKQEILEALRKEAKKIGKISTHDRWGKYKGECYEIGKERYLFFTPHPNEDFIVIYIGK